MIIKGRMPSAQNKEPKLLKTCQAMTTDTSVLAAASLYSALLVTDRIVYACLLPAAQGLSTETHLHSELLTGQLLL